MAVPQTTLTGWLREAGEQASAGVKNRRKQRKAKRPQDWRAEEELTLVVEVEGLSEEALG